MFARHVRPAICTARAHSQEMEKGHQEPQMGREPLDIQPLASRATCLVAVCLNTDIFPGQKEPNFCQAG